MLSRHTSHRDSTDVSLLAIMNNRFRSRNQLPLAFQGLLLPGAAHDRFERQLRQSLHEQLQTIMLHLSLPMQARFAQLYCHSQKTFALTLGMMRLLNIPEVEQMTIATGAFLHDIGKLAIDEALLNKCEALTPQEYALIQCHTVFGYDILTSYVKMPDVALLAHHHHERWDGEGYPARLAGEAIPLGARIIAIADAFDAMTSYRSYQRQRSPQEAVEELQRCAGTQFDPALVQLFCTWAYADPRGINCATMSSKSLR